MWASCTEGVSGKERDRKPETEHGGGEGGQCGLALGTCIISWVSFQDTPPNRAGRTGKGEGGRRRKERKESHRELLELINSHYSFRCAISVPGPSFQRGGEGGQGISSA